MTEGLAPYGSEGLHLPPRYAFAVDDPALPILLEVHVAVVGGQPECVELRARPRPGGPPVTSERLRLVTLRRYLRDSAAARAVRVQVGEPGEPVTVTPGTASVRATAPEPLVRVSDATVLARPSAPPQRHEMTPELLREVARVYTEEGSAAVRRRWNVSQATASRWVRAARARGHLPERDEEKNKR
jgi:hypothetical protein